MMIFLRKKWLRSTRNLRREKSQRKPKMSQEIEKMKGMLKRSQGMEDFMLDIEGLCLFPDVQLPLKFKMPKMDSFNGTGNPKNHLKQYVLIMKPLGLTKEQIILCFPQTLSGVALQMIGTRWLKLLHKNIYTMFNWM